MENKTNPYDIAVIGGGAAGSMAAIRAGQLGKRAVLIERNESLGKKLMMTGKGRCNITNTAPLDTFIKKFSPQGEFFRSAFFAFSNDDLMEFFRSGGLELKAERQGRVFPVTDRAGSVVSVLEESLKKNKVDVLCGKRITGIERKDGRFVLIWEDARHIEANKVIVSTGGASYKATGSTGDGFIMAERLGHKVKALKPALVPLTVKEHWVKELQGLALENIRVSFQYGKKKLISDVGEVMFTHFGVSGPLVLDMSGDIVSALEKHKEILMAIDLKPGLRKEQLESKLVHKFAVKGNIQIKNLMQDILPKRMIGIFLSLLNVSPERRTNQITRKERSAIIDTLKAFPLTIRGSLPIEEAMVTGGGVSMKDINPRTMESKIVPGLYFAGEIIEGAAPSGGYNLQQAFSTGYLAGENAAKG
ncbi:MAG: NAD(P)/FAD-dependent oxidoreductase [Candidatus Omnitrophota bacterium]|nr:NAD(P)/FAD-dependent oxidoreductase [Candidatus Omnitrophota bacterium]